MRGVSAVTQLISTLASFPLLYRDDIAYFIFYIAVLLGVIVAYFFVLWLFVYKTAWLIDKLDLENGFDEERIDLKNDFSSIVSIAIIVIGGIMLIDSLPLLCREIFTYYQEKSIRFIESQSIGWIISDLIKTVIGYLLMTNSKHITAFICRKGGKDEGNI
jgi:tellurite resistance protein TehA-like permease